MRPLDTNHQSAIYCLHSVSVWLVLLGTCLLGGEAASGQTSRQVLDAVRIEPHVGESLPMSAEFRNHRGETVRLDQIVGKRPVVLCLVYYECPMLCKLAADGLVRSVAGLSETVGQDFDVMLVSFDPRDTPRRAAVAREEALRKYARDETAAGWHFLTGTQANIDQVTDAVGFQYVWDEKTQQFAHASGLIIVSPQGVITEYLDGVRFSPRELITAVNRAANNELSPSEPTSFVRCYLYDPTTGRFGAAVQWTVRLLGLLTVVLLAVLVYRLSSREKVKAIQEEQS